MRKILILSSAGILMLILTIVSMSNMNVINLLVFGSEYGGGGSNKLEAYSLEEIEELGVDGASKNSVSEDYTMEAIQSGLVGSSGGGSGSLNLLWLLQNAKEPNKESYAYQLLQAYTKLNQGEFNNLSTHITPEAIAGSHYNETKLGSFVAPSVTGFGKVGGNTLLGKTVNGKKITLENATRADIVGNISGGSGVFTDVNGDGPDGPFQIEVFGQQNSYANKIRSDKKYDGYSFVDNMNFVDGKYNAVAASIVKSGVSVDPRAINILYGIYHNRGIGGMVYLMFGIPYSNVGATVKEGNYLHNTTIESMTPERIVDMAKFPEEFLKWFDKSNIPIEKVAGSSSNSRGLALLLTLANGGFVTKPLGAASVGNVTKLDNSVIQKLFPGQTNQSIVSHINANYVKKPWDVLGMSKSQYDKIYGSSAINSNYEEIYRNSSGQNTIFYIDKSVTSDNYKAGEKVVVRAIEGIAAGYMIDVGLSGAYVILNTALEAGIKSLTDGTVVDPSNPAIFYRSTSSETYNPAGAATGNFKLFLDGLGLSGKLTEPQQAQIQAMYDISGGPYDQGKRWSQTKDGRYYMDCSSFCSVGLHMGMVPQAKSPNPTTAQIKAGLWQKSKLKTAEINGKTYNAKTVQLDKNGKPMPESSIVNTTGAYSRKDTAWLDYLQTGDIVNGNGGSGHVITYLGKNNTGKDIVIEQHVSKVNATFSRYKAGQHFTMQAAWYSNKTSAGGNGKDFSGRMGLMPLWGDTTGTLYQAFRPVYNLK